MVIKDPNSFNKDFSEGKIFINVGHVEKYEIEKNIYNRCKCCPVAQAFKEMFPGSKISTVTCATSIWNKENKEVWHSDELQAAIREFDRTGEFKFGEYTIVFNNLLPAGKQAMEAL